LLLPEESGNTEDLMMKNTVTVPYAFCLGLEWHHMGTLAGGDFRNSYGSIFVEDGS